MQKAPGMSSSIQVLGHAPSEPTPGVLAGLRSTAVVMGPSLLLVLALAAGAVATVLFAIGPATPARLAAAAAGAIIAPIYLILRPFYLRWGASDAEISRSLPGDDILARPVAETTRAVTIAAPPAAIWPWLVQMGRGRGGLYSYDWLENLAGLDIHSVDRIVPELQRLAVGDYIALGPGAHNGYAAAAVETERALVLRLDSAAARFDSSWSFALAPIDATNTRLVVRFKLDGEPRRALGWLYCALIEIPHFVMERKMLVGIKERAEAGARA